MPEAGLPGSGEVIFVFIEKVELKSEKGARRLLQLWSKNVRRWKRAKNSNDENTYVMAAAQSNL